MKKVFLDTNFIIDYFIREDYSGEAEKVMKLGVTDGLEFYISYLSVANFAYIMRKVSTEKLVLLIERICNTFEIVSCTKTQIIQNLKEGASDFEDGLQYQATLYSECECIITRNKRDFSFATLPVFTPSEFTSFFSDQ